MRENLLGPFSPQCGYSEDLGKPENPGDAGIEQKTDRENSILFWRAKGEQLRVRGMERDLAERDQKLIVSKEVEIALGQFTAGLSYSFRAFPARVAPSLVGLRDVHLVQSRLESEIGIFLEAFIKCEYLAEEAPDHAANSPDVRGVMEVFKIPSKLARAFKNAVAAGVRLALRWIGRAAMPNILGRKPKPPTEDYIWEPEELAEQIRAREIGDRATRSKGREDKSRPTRPPL